MWLHNYRHYKIQDMDKLNSIIEKLTNLPTLGFTLIKKLVELAYDGLLAPPRYVWGLGGFVASAGCAALYLSRLWQTATPNEWLLVIRDGTLQHAGIGLTSFVLPNETVVKFPSTVEKAQFNAKNVTKEMQGVQIQGYAFWKVKNTEDGPFKCYKYMQGGNPNDNVRTMCESIIRNQLANTTLESVLRDRNVLKDSIARDLAPILKGWGIDLDTIQLTEVKICSKTLFEDLQAEYRQETHLTAEQKRLVTNERLRSNQLESNLKVSKYNEESYTRKQADVNKQALRRLESETAYYEQDCELKVQKLKSENQMEINRIKRDFEIERTKLINKQEADTKKKDQQIKNIKLQIENDKLYTPLAMRKYALTTTEQIYRRLSIKEVRINKFVDDEGNNTIQTLIPGLI